MNCCTCSKPRCTNIMHVIFQSLDCYRWICFRNIGGFDLWNRVCSFSFEYAKYKSVSSFSLFWPELRPFRGWKLWRRPAKPKRSRRFLVCKPVNGHMMLQVTSKTQDVGLRWLQAVSTLSSAHVYFHVFFHQIPFFSRRRVYVPQDVCSTFCSLDFWECTLHKTHWVIPN